MSNTAQPIVLDGVPFHHRMVVAADTRLHIVEGGLGRPVILLAGYPQSWYAWRRVMPLLAKQYHVYAVDLPGQGDSDRPLDGYDTFSAGERIRALAHALGHRRYFLAGHDIGAWITYPYVARYPQEVRRAVLLDANIPGITLPPTMQLSLDRSWKSWHFLLNAVPDLPEQLFAGRERILIEWFFQRKTANPAATFSPTDIDEYERVYKKTGGMTGMLGYYRAVYDDMEQNKPLLDTKLTTPILALGGDFGSAPNMYEALKPLGEHVEGGTIASCGHYMPEEQPAIIADRILTFFAADKD